MVTVATFAGATLAHPAGLSRLRMIADGMPYGGIKSSHRTPAEQQYLYDGWVRRLPGFNFALPPSKSKHVQGVALDMIVTSAAHKWMLTHAAAYGWTRTALPQEPWHWEFTGLTPTTAEDDDMPYTEGQLTTFAASGTATALELDQAQNAVRNIVWNLSTVKRGGVQVPALQELADAKTAAQAALAAVNLLAEKVNTPAPVDLDALAVKVAALAPKPEPIDYASIIEGVADELDAREIKRRTQVKDA